MKKLILFTLVVVSLWSCKKDDDADPDNGESCPPNEVEIAFAQDLSDNYAYPFDNADPETEDTKLDPLLDYLAMAKIVGLGEATHGTAEFFRMKDKLFRQLVLRKGFKAIIFELPWGNALVVNDFVTKSIGTADASVDQTVFWTYDTEEVRVMVEWIHDYNQSLSPEERILFVGCDPQGIDFNKEKITVEEFLNIVAPDSTAAIMEYYAQLPTDNLLEYKDASTEIHEANISGTESAYNYMESNRAEFITATSLYDYEVTLMAAHVIQHREELYRLSDFGEMRDELMAFYSEWWQRILGEESKVAVWAHNYHVMDGANINANWMGTFLRQNLGEDYKNVAFSFGKGSFNAYLANSDYSFLGGVRNQFIPEVPCRSVNQILSLVEGKQHYLIFDELEGDAKTRFETPLPFVQFGAGFNYTYLSNYTQEFRLARLFDVMIHFDETSASQLK